MQMQKAALYGIIAAIVVVVSIGVAFAATSISNPTTSTNLSTSNDDEVRVIKHLMGETEIAGTPESIIVLDSYLIEPLLAFDTEPIGMGGIDFINVQYPQTMQWSSVAEVGVEEPNLEVIAQLEPDLILAPFWVEGTMYEELSEIAPTVATNLFPTEGGPNALEQGKSNFMTVADALNRHDEGVAFLENMEAEFDEIENRVEAAGLKGKKFIFAELHADDVAPTVRIHLDDSHMSMILERIGLVNAAPIVEEPARVGRHDVDLEGLTTLDGSDVHFLYFRNISFEDTSTSSDPVPSMFRDNPVWNQLSFVQEGRIYPLDITYAWPGPLIATENANSIVDTLIETIE